MRTAGEWLSSSCFYDELRIKRGQLAYITDYHCLLKIKAEMDRSIFGGLTNIGCPRIVIATSITTSRVFRVP